MRKVVIEWSYPMIIDNILRDLRMSDIGLYYITRNLFNTGRKGNLPSEVYIPDEWY